MARCNSSLLCPISIDVSWPHGLLVLATVWLGLGPNTVLDVSAPALKQIMQRFCRDGALMNSNQLVALAPIITLSLAAIVVMLTIAIRRNFVLTCSVAACGIIMSMVALESPGQKSLFRRLC